MTGPQTPGQQFISVLLGVSPHAESDPRSSHVACWWHEFWAALTGRAGTVRESASSGRIMDSANGDNRPSSHDPNRHRRDLSSTRNDTVPSEGRQELVEGIGLSPSDIELLARGEHARWVAEREAAGVTYGPVRDTQHHPDLVPWDELGEATREKNRDAIRRLPELLGSAGLGIHRSAV
jgi:hypothetical protein